VRRLVIVCGALVIALAGCSGSGPTVRAIQKSMEPTIRSGEFIAVDTHAYDATQPQVGDIVSVRAPVNVFTMICAAVRRYDQPCRRAARHLTDTLLVKRILAGPGQRVAISSQGRARVDDVLQDEPYIIPCALLDHCRLPRAITVPPNQYFLLGDNRPYSSDSRYWGPVPQNAIQGQVTPPDPARR
jgi:signal peptidase I